MINIVLLTFSDILLALKPIWQSFQVEIDKFLIDLLIWRLVSSAEFNSSMQIINVKKK